MFQKYIIPLLAGFLFISPFVYAETVLQKPDIKTYSTPTSSTVVITSPSGYKSRVISTYDGKQFHTVATSTPLTQQDIQNMQAEFAKQEEMMRQMMEWQDRFFREQEKMFSDLWFGM